MGLLSLLHLCDTPWDAQVEVYGKKDLKATNSNPATLYPKP